MSKNLGPLYMPGDKVFYVGEKHKMDLTGKEGKPYVGLIHAGVTNQPGHYVVEFPDTKEHDSYVMSEQVLSKYRPANVKVDHRNDGPEIQRKRKRNSEED